MRDFAVGIDLGTSTSEIAVYQHKEPVVIPDPYTKSPIVPSLVAIDRRGRWRVGEEARSWVDVSGHGVREVKRLMGSAQTVSIQGVSYRPEEISAIILRKLKENAETSLGTTVSEVVISVPANFANAAREATLHAGKIAGLNVLRLISEPTAAALAFGIKFIDVDAQLVVFDFGGGTLDISVLEMVDGVLDVRASYGDPHLGGKDIDDLLIEMIWQKFNSQFPGANISKQAHEQVKSAAERAKIELSTNAYADIVIPAAARHQEHIVDLEVEISREEFNRTISPLLDRARMCINQALRAGRIRPEVIDVVLLVGGTTYVPAVKELVAEAFGKKPMQAVNPDLAVAMGAAVAAATDLGLLDTEQGLVFTDSVPYGLGIKVVEQSGDRLWVAYSSLIDPNTPIPYTTKRQYSLLHPDQREVEIELFQDHLGTARRIEDAIPTGVSGRIIDIPPALYGTPHPVEVEFSYDRDGIARIRATIPGVDRSVEIAYDHHAERMSEEELIAARNRIQSLVNDIESICTTAAPERSWQSNPEFKYLLPLIDRAERLIQADPDRYYDKMELLRKLREALDVGDTDRVNALAQKLTDWMADTDDGH